MNSKLTPDIAQAEKFLHLLDPQGVFTFQTFDDNKQRRVQAIPHVFHGSLQQHLPKLTALQQQGAGVFVMVNQGDGLTRSGSKSCRTGKNVIAVRALFADLDGAPIAPLLQDPHPDIIVESSPGRYHAYWLTRDCPMSEFTQRQKQIAAKFKSDPSVCDLPRVMRLPGFWHQKNTPFMTRVVFPA